MCNPNIIKIYNKIKRDLKLMDNVHHLVILILMRLSCLNYSFNNKHLSQCVNRAVQLYVGDFCIKKDKHPWIELIKNGYVSGFVAYILQHSPLFYKKPCCVML